MGRERGERTIVIKPEQEKDFFIFYFSPGEYFWEDFHGRALSIWKTRQRICLKLNYHRVNGKDKQ